MPSPILQEWKYTIAGKVFVQRELTLFQLFTILRALPALDIDPAQLQMMLTTPKSNAGLWFSVLGAKLFDLIGLLISPVDLDATDSRSFRQKLADPRLSDYPELEHLTSADAVLILDRFFLRLETIAKMPEFQHLKKPIQEQLRPIWKPFADWIKTNQPPSGNGI